MGRAKRKTEKENRQHSVKFNVEIANWWQRVNTEVRRATQLEDDLTIRVACGLAPVPLVRYCRTREGYPPREAEVVLCDTIQYHSNRSTQYCVHSYVKRRQDYGFQIYISCAGNPFDNTLAKDIIRTFKADYHAPVDARNSIGYIFDNRHNRRQLYSSPDYCSPRQSRQQPDQEQ